MYACMYVCMCVYRYNTGQGRKSEGLGQPVWLLPERPAEPSAHTMSPMSHVCINSRGGQPSLWGFAARRPFFNRARGQLTSAAAW